MRRQTGFTLIEVLIVLTIIAIIGVIAFPTYAEHNARGYRADAQEFMLEVASRQHELLMSESAYAGLDALGLEVPEDLARHYEIRVEADNEVDPPAFVITAAGKRSGLSELTLTSTGSVTPADEW